MPIYLLKFEYCKQNTGITDDFTMLFFKNT